MSKIKLKKRLGIKIASVSLFITSFLLLITQSVWTGSQDVVNQYNGKSVVSLIFALLAFMTSSLIMLTIFTKFNFGKSTRKAMLMSSTFTLLFIIITFSVSIKAQFDIVGGPSVGVANTLFFTFGLIGYLVGEVIINKNKFKI